MYDLLFLKPIDPPVPQSPRHPVPKAVIPGFSNAQHKRRSNYSEAVTNYHLQQKFILPLGQDHLDLE